MSIGLLVLRFRPYLEVVTNAGKTNQHDESTVDRHCKPKYFLMCFAKALSISVWCGTD